jgi:hypothetical protein
MDTHVSLVLSCKYRRTNARIGLCGRLAMILCPLSAKVVAVKQGQKVLDTWEGLSKAYFILA